MWWPPQSSRFSYGVIVIGSVVRLVVAVWTGIFPTAVLAQSATDQSGSTKEIQICHLFRRLDAFDGKRIAVRGVYRFSKELAGLYSEGCQRHLVLDGAERAQALDTVFVGTSLEEQAEFAHFTELVNGIAKSGRRQAIHVTFVGTLLARNPELHRLGQRKGERMFGHLGVYPARLDVIRIQSITVEDEAGQPSNMELRE